MKTRESNEGVYKTSETEKLNSLPLMVMSEEEKFKLKLSEAKDYLMHIDMSIKETRNKVFYLIGFVFALLGYLSTDLIDKIYLSPLTVLFYITASFLMIILYVARHSMFPKGYRLNGIIPESFDKIDNGELSDNIIYTYQCSIDNNLVILKDISNGYKSAFKALFIYLLVSLLALSFSSFLPKCLDIATSIH